LYQRKNKYIVLNYRKNNVAYDRGTKRDNSYQISIRLQECRVGLHVFVFHPAKKVSLVLPIKVYTDLVLLMPTPAVTRCLRFFFFFFF
jgi:hypothetical protein